MTKEEDVCEVDPEIEEALYDPQPREVEAVEDDYPEDLDEETLYDPAPRRRRRRTRRRTTRRRRAYDPAPRRRRYRRRAKSGLAKLGKFAMPGGLLAGFYLPYKDRGKRLCEQGVKCKDDGTPMGLFDSLKYDLENLDTEKSFQALQDKAGQIVAEVALGQGVNYLPMPRGTKRIAKLLGDVLTGHGFGTAIATFISGESKTQNGGGTGQQRQQVRRQTINVRPSQATINVQPQQQQTGTCPGCKWEV